MQIGITLRDYKIQDKIGSGGMGDIYLAEHALIGKKYALKVLKPELAAQHNSDGNFVQRFILEGKVLADLIHPNIVTMHNFFVADNQHIMVLEFAPGITLAKYLKQHGRLSEEESMKIFSQLLDAVGFAHTRGVVHRDLKPSNIMYDSASGMVKILDFGTAKILGEQGLTGLGASIGTISYMSPEQIKAIKDIDHRTDIFNLGLILYEMLTGELPFNSTSESAFEVLNSIVNDEYPDVRAKNNLVSDSAAEVIRLATMKDRGKRPVTCHKISEMLKRDTGSANTNATDAVVALLTPYLNSVSKGAYSDAMLENFISAFIPSESVVLYKKKFNSMFSPDEDDWFIVFTSIAAFSFLVLATFIKLFQPDDTGYKDILLVLLTSSIIILLSLFSNIRYTVYKQKINKAAFFTGRSIEDIAFLFYSVAVNNKIEIIYKAGNGRQPAD